MSGRLEALLGLLADGTLHSGADLAARLGVSRAAVWKLVGELRSRDVPVESLPRRGYRLPEPVELLDAWRIEQAMTAQGRRRPERLDVLFEIDSTNAHLYGAPPPRPGHPWVAFAELQHAGRGRRGRTWIAPFGSSLTFSLSWTFAESPADLAALGLAAGVAVAETLNEFGAGEVRLKWPNDVVWRGRKLGGLLLQLRSEQGGAANVVAGLGLNLAVPAATREAIASSGALPAADLREVLGDATPGRNALAAALAGRLLDAFDAFAQDGFSRFAARWAALDALAGARVNVAQGADSVEGEARGVDGDGALLLEVGGRLERYYSGDVSLRPVTPG
jgi:BirA family biotin operon repressor/biotin-[acetyl-CoA-carboxylase] ligase